MASPTMLFILALLWHGHAKTITLTRSHCLSANYMFPTSEQYNLNSTVSSSTPTSLSRTLTQSSSKTPNSASSSIPSARDIIVLPTLNPYIDRSALSQLTPSMNTTLQYAELNGPYVAIYDFNMIYPQVTLENSDCVAILNCDTNSGEFEIGFEREECYKIAMETWAVDLVLITNQAGCNPANERGWLQTLGYEYLGYMPQQPQQKKKAKRQDKSRMFPWGIRIKVKPVTIAEVSSLMTMQWGQRVDGEAVATFYTQTLTSYFEHSRRGRTSTVFTTVVSTTSLMYSQSSSTRSSSSSGGSSENGGMTSTNSTPIKSLAISSSAQITSNWAEVQSSVQVHFLETSSAPVSSSVPELSSTPTHSSRPHATSSSTYSATSTLEESSSSQWWSSSSASMSSSIAEASSSNSESLTASRSSLTSSLSTISSLTSSTWSLSSSEEYFESRTSLTPASASSVAISTSPSSSVPAQIPSIDSQSPPSSSIPSSSSPLTPAPFLPASSSASSFGTSSVRPTTVSWSSFVSPLSTSSVFTTISSILSSMGATSRTSAAALSALSPVTVSSAAVSSATVSWDPPVRSIYNLLLTGITISNGSNSSNLVLKPVQLLNETAGMEPLRLNDTLYQASLLANFTADGLDTGENLTMTSIDALNSMFGNASSNGTISNITQIMGVNLVVGAMLGNISFNDSVVTNATLMKRGERYTAPVYTLPRGRRHRPYSPSDLAIRDNPVQALAKRDDGWDTFFDIMGDDLIGELCEVCGLISAGRDLYNGIKCLFGGCPAPKQVQALEGTFTHITKISVAYSPNALVFIDRGTRVNCVKCGITVSSLKIEGKVVIIPSEGTVVSAIVTVAQSLVSDLLYNIYTPGPYSGGFELAASSLQLDSLTAPGVVTMAPKFLYGLGLQVQTDAALNVQAGATLTTNDARARFDVKGQAGENQKSWQPTGAVTYPQFSKPGRVVLTPYMKTDVQITLTIFKKTTKNAIALVSQTNLGFDAQVLATTQNLKKRGLETRTVLGKRAVALIPALKPGPTCAAYSLRVTTTMKTLAGARVGGKSVQLFNQNYPFGSRCVYFPPPPPPPPPPPVPTTTSRSSSSLRASTSNSSKGSVSAVASSAAPPATLPSYPACANCGPVILNGDFDIGSLAGWTRTDSSTANPVLLTGGIPSTGRYLEVNSGGGASLALETALRTVIGFRYTFVIRYQFSELKNDCYLNGFLMNSDGTDGAYVMSLSTRFDAGAVGAFVTAIGSTDMLASSCSTKIRLRFACYGGQSVIFRLDSVAVTQNSPARVATCP